MSDLQDADRPRELDGGEGASQPQALTSGTKPRAVGRLFGLGVFSVLAAGLAFGGLTYYQNYQRTLATADQRRDFVPNVRVSTVRASDGIIRVTLPGTTSAFAAANIYARATGYIEERYADIGDQVKAGQPLAKIIARELDDQIAQAEATLSQNKASVQQVQANLDLARVTWGRDKPLVDKGWTTPQQGSIDVQGIKALEASLAVAQANVAAQEAQLRVLNHKRPIRRSCAIRRRHHPAQCGRGLTGPSRCDQRHLHVHDHAKRRNPHAGLRTARSGFRLGPGGGGHHTCAGNSEPDVPRQSHAHRRALQPGTRTLLTEIDVPNGDGALSAGIDCTIELHIPRKTPSLFVPAEAIIFNRDGLQVALFEDGVARIRKVSVARDLGTAVEVFDGVKPGDQVILNPAVNLVEGSKVRSSPQDAGPTK